jgi:hypothetical protein
VENTGNAALVVEAAAADPDERLDLTVSPASTTVNPGGTATLVVSAHARQRVINGQAPTLGFVVAVAPAAGAPPTAFLTPGGPIPAPLRPPGRLDPLLPGTGSLLRFDGSVVVRPLLAFGLPQLAAVAIPLALVAVVAMNGLGHGNARPRPRSSPSASAPVARSRPAHRSPSSRPARSASATDSPSPSPDARGEDRVAHPGPALGHRVRDRARRQPRRAGRLA